MNCADVQSVREIYVVGALTPEECDEVELHVADCVVCRGEVEDAWQVARQLRLAVPQVGPPGALKNRLLREATTVGEEVSDRSRWPEGGPALRPATASGKIVVFPGDARRARWAWSSAVAAALPLAAAVWLGYQATVLTQRVAETEIALQSSTRDARVVAELLGHQIQAGSQGMARIDGTEMAPAASGMVYYGTAAREGIFVASGLPHLPRDQVYQVWLVQGRDRMNGGTFVLEEGGKGMVFIKSPMPLDSLDAIDVTMEPMGGSASPRGAAYMHGQVRIT